MLNRNYIRIMATCIGTESLAAYTEIQLRTTRSDWASQNNNVPRRCIYASSTNTDRENGVFIIPSSNSAEPTFTEYTLDGDLTGSLTMISCRNNVTISTSFDTGNIQEVTATYKNMGSVAITVNSIYMIVKSAYTHVLARELLATPVVIAPGETYTFTMRVSI